MNRIGWVLALAVVALSGVTVYRNVLADDSAVRAMAEQTARAAAGCGDCKPTRVEGKRGMISESLTFTMQNGASIAVSCRRPYIAFGDYACTATKH